MKALNRQHSDIHKYGTSKNPNPKFDEYLPQKPKYEKVEIKKKFKYDKYFRNPKKHTEYDRDLEDNTFRKLASDKKLKSGLKRRKSPIYGKMSNLIDHMGDVNRQAR
jgi:hypothetical protein